MLKLRNLCSVTLLSLILSACTLDEQRPTNVKYIDKSSPVWKTHLAEIKKINAYSASGQLGYINSKERFSTQFNWHYNNPKSYSLKLSSTISSSTLQLDMHARGLTISDNKGRQRTEADAKLLLREIVGMDFPLEQFALWLKGQPDEHAAYEIGENHLLATFNYPIDGQTWTADYLTYNDNTQPKMPQNILLKSQDQTLKIRIDKWKF
ncbi:outer membrane lipoprotein LolB [Cricetibacter osteomyelitidis]|uniref:Outer-membrane lipoprotein LolB n=1 Tax=Cricetibacter osteomyelitidis TaxID=1521931 RepID=A0A4R2T5U6_9PAST|nr:lipoprotein insertase outer membrane protein LolB [Cricetibacter osteomyelitidis]TCP97810.1 outer membrane lipoprotein LolB [Cricetibacter osteomyelitidis]